MITVALLLCFAVALLNARTITWTNAGGNPLWNNAGNWDCQCLPTIDDDVIIDILAIPGRVQIGGVIAPALARSLTLGGQSRLAQTLTVNGALTIGTGASTLNANGYISVSASPQAPFLNSGTFTIHGVGFSFSSGVLGGPGTFVIAPDGYLNLTQSASKTIATNVVVNGKAVCPTDRSTDIVLQAGGNLVIGSTGTFTTTKTLTMSTDSTSSFNVKGSFTFSGDTLGFQGNGYNIGSWSITRGTATINNKFFSDSLSLASGAVLQLIGAPTDAKTFNKITGSGTVQNLGGANTFGTLVASTFSASGGNATVNSGIINMLSLSGAFLAGGKIQATEATLSTGFVNGGLQLEVGTLNLQGLVSISDNGSGLLVTGTANVNAVSQLTLTAGSSLVIAKGAQLKQTSGFTIVQGAPAATSPKITNNGVFTSQASFFLSGVPVSGTGSIDLGTAATWSLTNVVLSQSLFSSSGKVTLSVGSFNVPSISGSGAFSGNPVLFNSTSFGAGSFDLEGGTVVVGNTTLNSVTLNNGANFFVSTSATINTLRVLGGVLTGPPKDQVVVSVKQTSIEGPNVQKLENVVLKTSSLSLNCATSCQLVTNNALVNVGSGRL